MIEKISINIQIILFIFFYEFHELIRNHIFSNFTTVFPFRNNDIITEQVKLPYQKMSFYFNNIYVASLSGTTEGIKNTTKFYYNTFVIISGFRFEIIRI